MGTPLIVSASPATVEALKRVDLKGTGEGAYDESWVQQLVHNHPSILPISEVEPGFWPAVPVCMELGLVSGSLDNLLITPLGDLLAIECKLWKNMEARRKVVAQIIDYAKDLQSLSYDSLERAIEKSRGGTKFNLFAYTQAAAGEAEASLDEPQFIDAVSRNLRRGRCLLIILGDGITEGVEGMTDFLQQHAGMHFAMVLVQLSVYEMPGTDNKIVVPSVILKTTNIVRAIVQINENRVEILPAPDQDTKSKGASLTDEEFFERLDKLHRGISIKLIEFLNSCDDLQVQWEIKKTLIVKLVIGGLKTIAFVILDDGRVDFGYAWNSKIFFRPFVERIIAAVPGSALKESPKSWYAKKQKTGEMLTVWELLDHAEGVRAALEVLNASMRNVESMKED